MMMELSSDWGDQVWWWWRLRGWSEGCFKGSRFLTCLKRSWSVANGCQMNELYIRRSGPSFSWYKVDIWRMDCERWVSFGWAGLLSGWDSTLAEVTFSSLHLMLMMISWSCIICSRDWWSDEWPHLQLEKKWSRLNLASADGWSVRWSDLSSDDWQADTKQPNPQNGVWSGSQKQPKAAKKQPRSSQKQPWSSQKAAKSALLGLQKQPPKAAKLRI